MKAPWFIINLFFVSPAKHGRYIGIISSSLSVLWMLSVLHNFGFQSITFEFIQRLQKDKAL